MVSGIRIPWAVFRIPKLRIPNSTSKNLPDSETWIPLHETKNYTFADIGTLTECVKTQFMLFTVKGTNAHLTFLRRTYFDPSSRRLVTKSHQSQSSQPAVRPISWTSVNRAFSLAWPASMLIYWNQRIHLHEKRVLLPEDFLGGTPIWPPSCENAL